MKYKLNVIESNHKIGFVFTSMELFTSRLERVKDKVQHLNRTLRIVENNTGAQYEMRLFVD